MSFLSGLLDRAKGLLGNSPPEVELATDAVLHDRFDEVFWQDARKMFPAIDRDIAAASQELDYVEELYQDAFNLLGQMEPTIRETDDMKPSHRPMREMVKAISEMPEVQQLRTATRGDSYSAAMGVVSMKDDLATAASKAKAAAQAAEEAERKRQEAQQAAEEAMRKLDEAQQAAEQAQPDPETGEVDPEAEAAAQAAADEAATAVGTAEAAAQAAEQAGAAEQSATASAVSQARGDMRQAAQKAAEEAEEEASLMAAFGVSDGELQRMSFEERYKLATRLRTNRMAKFAKLIGQFKALQAAESRRKVQHAPDEITNVKLGNDLTRLIPSEFDNLAIPELEDDFWLRYSNSELLCYELTGTEKMGQGPIIVVCDESGSMQGSYYGGVDLGNGTPEAWSKALSLALCDQARKQGRDFHYIGFSSSRQQYHVSFPKGVGKLTDVISMTEHFFAGGTAYEEPLLQALDIIESDYNERNKPRPDVVFITDDEYGQLSESFMRRWTTTKEAASIRCFGIAIGAGTSGALEAIADNVRSVTALTSDPKVVTDLFRTI